MHTKDRGNRMGPGKPNRIRGPYRDAREHAAETDLTDLSEWHEAFQLGPQVATNAYTIQSSMRSTNEDTRARAFERASDETRIKRSLGTKLN